LSVEIQFILINNIILSIATLQINFLNNIHV